MFRNILIDNVLNEDIILYLKLLAIRKRNTLKIIYSYIYLSIIFARSADAHNNNITNGNEQLFSIVSHLSLLFVFDCIIQPMKFSKH